MLLEAGEATQKAKRRRLHDMGLRPQLLPRGVGDSDDERLFVRAAGHRVLPDWLGRRAGRGGPDPALVGGFAEDIRCARAGRAGARPNGGGSKSSAYDFEI